jgi:hypothetical protein
MPRASRNTSPKDVVVTIGHVNLVTVNLVTSADPPKPLRWEADAAQVETTSTQLGAVMTDTAIRELPLASRVMPIALLQLQPGVQSELGADFSSAAITPELFP